MSQIKQLVSEDIESQHSDPFYAPGELEAEMRAYELSKYSIEELQAEISRQIYAPVHETLDELRTVIDNFGKPKEERPTDEVPF